MGINDGCSNLWSQLVAMLLFLISICTMGICNTTSQLELYQDEEAKVIQSRYNQFYLAMNEEDYETGYSFMSPAYQQTHTVEEFKLDFGFVGEGWLSLHPNHSLKFTSDSKAYLYPLDKWENPIWWSGPEYELIKVNGEWYFTGEYIYHLD